LQPALVYVAVPPRLSSVFQFPASLDFSLPANDLAVLDSQISGPISSPVRLASMAASICFVAALLLEMVVRPAAHPNRNTDLLTPEVKHSTTLFAIEGRFSGCIESATKVLDE